MEIPNKTKKPFQFENPRQNKIHASLKRFIGNAPASFYKDACKIYKDGCDLETKTHLIGHLMREIFGWIIDIMLPVDYLLTAEEKKESDKNKDSYQRKIKYAGKVFGIDKNPEMIQFWLDHIANNESGLHSWAHRESMVSVHPLDNDFVELWEGTELLLDFLLDKIEAKYLSYTEQIDSIIAKATISSSDIKSLKKHIPLNQTTMNYFFDKLNKPECLTILKENDFFKYPQKPIVHEDGGVSFPYWPQMTYLVKMSKISAVQDEVLAICLDINTDNTNIQICILDIALNLPADKSVQLIKKSYNWFLQIKSWFDSEKYGKLFVHLAKSGYKKEALELAKNLLRIQPNPRKPAEYDGYVFPHDPVAIIDDWHYEEVLKKDFPTLIEITGFDAVIILLDQIENYINMSDIHREKGSKDDYSYIWRNSIENSTQNVDHGIKDILINGARDALEFFLKQYPDQIITVISELESRKLNIFKRMSLHLLRLFPVGAEKLIAERLLNKNEFKYESNRLTHEYFLLAEDQAFVLNKAQRNQIWSWIINGANKDEYKKMRKKNYGVDATMEEVQIYVKNWQMYHLLPFINIDPRWEKYYEELTTVVGKPDHPSFRSWSTSGRIDPKNIASFEQLKKMEPKDVVEYLKNWKPDSNDPLNHAREDIGRAIINLITDNPSKWLDSLTLFADLNITYMKDVIIGYRDTVKQGKEFNWIPVLNLCKAILIKPIDIKDKKSSTILEENPEANWSRHTIVELLLEGVKEGKCQLPYSLREEVWEVIKPLTKDPNPTPEYEVKFLASHPDPLSLVINTIRGDALDLAIQYGVWIKNSCTKEEQLKWNLIKNAPELISILDEHLDLHIDPSVGIRALYGEKLGQLAWLDEQWIIKNKDIIFPHDPKLQKYFDAAWEAYITFVPAYDNLFKIIKNQYQRAIDELGKHIDGKHHPENPEQKLTHHLTAFYWRGLIELETSLFADFYNKASTELKKEVIDFIGRVSEKNDKVPRKVINRFVTLLERRILELQSKDVYGTEVQEFQSLSWWVASEMFEDTWILEKLFQVLQMGCDIQGDHLVIERFKSIANLYPLQVIRCARLMVDNDKKGWGILSWRDDLRYVINTVLKSENADAQDEARDFINRLAARGHLEFKDLI